MKIDAVMSVANVSYIDHELEVVKTTHDDVMFVFPKGFKPDEGVRLAYDDARVLGAALIEMGKE